MRRLVNAFYICALMVSAVFAQADRGTITGTVTDPQGPPLSQARGVSAEICETHNVVQSFTSSTGNLPCPNCQSGSGTSPSRRTGFKRFRSLKNTIQVAQTLRVDAVLEARVEHGDDRGQAEAVAIRTETRISLPRFRIRSLSSFRFNGPMASTAIRRCGTRFPSPRFFPG